MAKLKLDNGKVLYVRAVKGFRGEVAIDVATSASGLKNCPNEIGVIQTNGTFEPSGALREVLPGNIGLKYATNGAIKVVKGKMNPANSQLKYDNDGFDLTESFEDCKLIPYRDGNGVPTNGFGNTHNVTMGVAITRNQAVADLAVNVTSAEVAVKTYVDVPLTQGEFDGLTDLVFNIGEGHFSKSTVLRELNEGNKQAAHDAFMMWDKIAGATSKGLARRRLAEEELFATGMVTNA